MTDTKNISTETVLYGPEKAAKPAYQNPNPELTKRGATDELARILYPEKAPVDPIELQAKTVFNARKNDLQVVLGLTAEEVESEQREVAAAFKDASVDFWGTGEKLYNALVDTRLREIRGTLASDEDRAREVQRNNEKIRMDVAAIYGPAEGAALIMRTQKFVEAHQGLHELLSQHGIGSHPGIVLDLVDHVKRVGYGK